MIPTFSTELTVPAGEVVGDSGQSSSEQTPQVPSVVTVIAVGTDPPRHPLSLCHVAVAMKGGEGLHRLGIAIVIVVVDVIPSSRHRHQ